MKQARSKSTIARRKWIKLYPVECLNGSIRYQLTSEQRGVWYDLLSFSSLCSNDGAIADRDGRAYPHAFIANRLNITEELLESTLANCIKEGRMSEDEAEDGQGVLRIRHWALYQSEYDRQKPYREKAKYNKAWDAMPEEEQAAAIEKFGPCDTWDVMTWIAVTGKMTDTDRTDLNADLKKEGIGIRIPG